MSSGKYLVPPGENKSDEELWNETWKRLGRFLPNLHEELFPPPSRAETVAEAERDNPTLQNQV